MQVYGVTGKSGSGKSTFARLLAERLGCACVDIDRISNEVIRNLEPAAELAGRYGKEIIGQDGAIDRKALGRILFADKAEMDWYNLFLWGYVRKDLDRILAGGEEAVVFEWMFLPICGEYWDICSPKILVEADAAYRKAYVMKRDGIPEDYYDSRDANGLDYGRVPFDYVVENDYRMETFRKKIDEITKRTE